MNNKTDLKSIEELEISNKFEHSSKTNVKSSQKFGNVEEFIMLGLVQIRKGIRTGLILFCVITLLYLFIMLIMAAN